jgi:hypothetical protein
LQQRSSSCATANEVAVRSATSSGTSLLAQL